jgi:hypothetical protein
MRIDDARMKVGLLDNEEVTKHSGTGATEIIPQGAPNPLSNKNLYYGHRFQI